MRRIGVAATLGLAAIVALTACSTKGAETSGGSSGGVKTDFGVTKDKITLGLNMDHSGVFKTFDVGLLHGSTIWKDEVNKAGGICGRQVEFNDVDNGYQADKAVTIYAAQKSKILGYIQVGGSPTISALKEQFKSDKILAGAMAWASTNLDNPYVMIVGSTYDVDAINALAYLQKQSKIADGDKIGHIYIDSEYGKDALLGTKFYASKHKQTIVEAPIAAGDTDMSAVITKMKSDGVKAVFMTSTAAAMSSAATQMSNQDLTVPLMGNAPTFQANLLDTPAKNDIIKNYYQVSNVVPYGDTQVPAMVKLAQEYQTQYSADPPDYTVPIGYATGLVWQATLEKACTNKDMTREGILKAYQSLSGIDMKGLFPKLDFSHPGRPSSLGSMINVADPSVPGNLAPKETFFESNEVKEYKAPFDK